MGVSGDDRQIIYLHLPCLPIQRMARVQGWSLEEKVGLYQREKGADRLVYLSSEARADGVQAGLSVADARARHPDMCFAPVDQNADQALLTAFARWAFRYSPVTGIDADGLGIWIEATGASHLFAHATDFDNIDADDTDSGLKAMCADLYRQISQTGLRASIASASTFGAAFALAHYHRDVSAQPVHAPARRSRMREALADLPLAALRLPLDILHALSQAGLRQISHLYPLGRADLTARFGPDIVLRYSQLFGDQPDNQIPVQAVQPVSVTKIWAEPVMGYEALCHMVSQLTAEMAERLLDAELAARSFELGWQRTDGQVSCLLFRLSRPGRREQTLQRLIAGAAEKIDAEFGVEYSWIQAHELTVDVPVTALLGTDQDSLQASQISDMVDILAARLGPDKVQRVVSQSDWHIADSQAYQPVADVTYKTGQWPMPVLAGLAPPRPVRLLDRPEPVKVVAMMPDHPPAMIRWRHHNWTVLRATGPERVGPRWWDPNRTDKLSRDYYRVEVEDGRRLWLCREGLVERGDEISWFIYGLFS